MKKLMTLVWVAVFALALGGMSFADPGMMKSGEDCPLKAAGKDCPLEAGKKDKDCDHQKDEKCEKEQHRGHGDNCPLQRYAVKGKHTGSIPLILKNKEALKITDDQKKQLVSILVESQKAKIRKKAEEDILEIDLKAELHKSPVDLEKASALLREVEKVRADIAIDCLTAREGAMKVLNDEQREKLKELARGGKK
ncbi:MAG: Spy/CpxP family protein refolding chaperone [Nitrospirota bacterium]|nr:Spy/CpxP family protein refolding chaperone [Nitrospirota bacterium]